MTFGDQLFPDDRSEVAFRHFMRGPTAQRSRLRNTVIGALMAPVVVFALSKMLGFKTPSFWIFAMPALVTGAINYFGFDSFLRSRLRRYFQLEARGRPAWETRYLVADGKLSCVSDGVELTFPLSSLVSVSEDDSRLEISFGRIGLCVIPKRAFESVEFKEAFVHAIKIRVAEF